METRYILNELVFVKLGGSLITNKTQPMSARGDVISRCAREIGTAFKESSIRLMVGHGSGSFGHQVASQYGTRQGVTNSEDWYGYAQVSYAARELNRLVIQALLNEGLPAVSLPPSASAKARQGELTWLDSDPVRSLIERRALPVVFGDVSLDEIWGGTIVSTEQVFVYLATRLKPARIVLAGEVEGVFDGVPGGERPVSLYHSITSANYHQVLDNLKGARGADVTGGMRDKITRMYNLVARQPETTVHIVSGLEPWLLLQAIWGQAEGKGTTISFR